MTKKQLILSLACILRYLVVNIVEVISLSILEDTEYFQVKLRHKKKSNKKKRIFEECHSHHKNCTHSSFYCLRSNLFYSERAFPFEFRVSSLGIKLSSWKSSRNRAWASGFKSSLKPKIYSQALYATPAVWVCTSPRLGVWGSHSCPGAGVMPAVVIWIPWLSKCPVCPQYMTPYGGCLDIVLFVINTAATPVSHERVGNVSAPFSPHSGVRWQTANVGV